MSPPRIYDLDQAVVIALGSNLAGAWPTREALLEAALGRLPARGVTVVARSRWWRSTAWPEPADPPFVNAVALVETRLPPGSLIATLLGLECTFGRRPSTPNAPRTLDLDLIAYGRKVIDRPGLAVPHPRAHERLFVMGPLAEIAPAWRHPVSGVAAPALAEGAVIGRDASSKS